MAIRVVTEVSAMSRRLRAIAPLRVDPSPIIVTARPFYGAKIGDLRRAARKWLREHASSTSAEVAQFADGLWETAVREEMVVAALVLKSVAAERPSAGIRRLDRWGRLLDNWETTDQLGQSLVGPWAAADPVDRLTTLDTLAGRRNEWLRRLSLVGCIGVLRGESPADHWPRVAAIVLRLAPDSEAAIPKAISWVCRVASQTCRPELVTFLASHEKELPSIAVRETKKKLETGRKQ